MSSAIYRDDTDSDSDRPLSEAPPPYSRHAYARSTKKSPSEHTYSLKHKKGDDWLSMKLLSSASSSNDLPRILEGQPFAGSVTLNLPETGGEAIHAIVLRFRGHLSTGSGSQERVKFFQHLHVLWSKGDILQDEVKKIKGEHHGVDEDAQALYRLPQTFSENSSCASINYTFGVQIVRGALRRDNKLETSVVFVPTIQPDEPSPLRQRAYKTLSQFLPDDRTDKEGWTRLSSVVVAGKMFDGRSTSVACMLALANPLSYTRGTAIPCTLTVESQDPEALDYLATPESIVVSLRRQHKYIPGSIISANRKLDAINNAQSTLKTIEFATWWPKSASASSRRFHGEIYLSDELETSTSFAYMSIEYSVAMYPFDPCGFVSSQGPLEALISKPVVIANTHAPGPRAIRYSTSRSSRSTTLLVNEEEEDGLEMLTKFYDAAGGCAPPALYNFA